MTDNRQQQATKKIDYLCVKNPKNKNKMKTVIVNIPEEKEMFFLTLLKEFRFKSRVLSDEEKEDTGLLALMYEREKEESFPIETTEQILNSFLRK